MKPGKTGYLFAMIALMAFCAPLFAQNDMPKSADHPNIPRIEGAVIYGYDYSDYDEGVYLLLKEGKIGAVKVGGKRTRIFYIVPRSVTRAGVLRNYEVALSELGEQETIYTCSTACPNDTAEGLVWKKEYRIPTTIKGTEYLYVMGNSPSFTDQGYAYYTVTTDSARYHVSVYSALFTGGGVFRMQPDVKNTRSIHVDITEEADFKPTLQVVTPDEITESINETGHIALYGINFDFDSDALKPDSTPALEAITTALNSSSDLKMYVVGHTDNQGSYEYNLDLSKRRAASVVRALTDSHGVSGDRLIAVGVGPVAPVSSNRSEEGQALNRRVELVEL